MAKKELPPLQMASDLPAIEYVTTGIKELDKIVKGFPRGRISEIYGMEGTGKTSLTFMAIAGAQKEGHNVLFIDVENALNVDRAAHFGVDTKKLAVSNETIIENIAEIVIGYIKKFDVIVIDSLAAMVPAAEYDGDSGAAHMGLKARIMGQFMRKVTSDIAKHNVALVFINQERMSLEAFGPKRFTPGGKAVPFATSLRIELTTRKSVDKIEKGTGDNKERVGQRVKAVVTKSKVGKPFAEVMFNLMY